MAGFPTLKGSWHWLGSGHTAYRRASFIDLYLHAKFHWNRRNVLRTDGHLSKSQPTNCSHSTYIRTWTQYHRSKYTTSNARLQTHV